MTVLLSVAFPKKRMKNKNDNKLPDYFFGKSGESTIFVLHDISLNFNKRAVNLLKYFKKKTHTKQERYAKHEKSLYFR